MREHYDIAIIGGGTVGCMAFLDAVSRGFRCILIEKQDIGMQTNHASLGLVQAGANYLIKDRGFVYMNAIDCGVLRRVARDLVRKQKIIIPVFRDAMYPLWLWDGFMAGYDVVTARYRPGRHFLLSKKELLTAEPFLKNDVSGGIAFFEWITDPVALARACVNTAMKMGGVVQNNCAVVEADMAREQHKWQARSLIVQEHPSGDRARIDASVFINASGPWAPSVLKEVFHIPPFQTRMTRGTSIVLQKKLAHSAMVVFDNDKYITILPLEGGRTLIGPTNRDIDEETALDPDRMRPENSEIQELLEVARHHLNVQLYAEDIVDVRCGLRPQLPHRAVHPNDISHEFMIIDHKERDGILNLLTVFGGKLSSQVRMAKETVDAAGKKLGQPREWRLPLLRITQSEVSQCRETARDYDRIRKLYRKKYALSHTDDINKVARMRKIRAVVSLAPFLAWGFLKAILRRIRNREK